MLVAAVVLPLGIGLASLFLLEPADRPSGVRRVTQVLRGYPYALVLASVLVFLVVVAPIRKIRSLVKRWEDAHIPVVVKPNGYERVADDIEVALDRAGMPIERAKAPAILELPSRLLAWVGGASVRRLVPDRVLVLKSRGLDVTIYPSDVAMSGTAERVARSRAALAATLSFTAAYQTTSKESQEIEDRLEAIATSREALAWRALAEVDERIERLVVPYDDWEVLYRIRLQVELELRRGRETANGEHRDGSGPLALIGELLRRIIG
jgi:hypothetical protein